MKKSFLEQIYFGNIVPGDRGFKRNKRLYEVSKLSEEAYDKMKATVPAEYHDAIDHYVAVNTSYCSEAELAAFVYGVRYMFRFMMDAVEDKFAEFEDAEGLE